MLRWMCGKTRCDKIRNCSIIEIVGVTPTILILWKIGLGGLDM